MGSPAVIDIDALLAPIPGDSPVGMDIRADSSPSSLYYRAKDARVAARTAERAAFEGEAPLPAEWDEVIATGTEILAKHTKDLEVAAWMTEALVRVHGFAGLRDGLRLIDGLVGAFWNGLFPLPDEDGVETRVGPVTGLNGEGGEGTLILPIRMRPLTQGSDHAFALWQFEQASELERLGDSERRKAKIAAGALTMDAFMASVAETAPEWFRQLLDDVAEARVALLAMAAAFEPVAGADAPPVGKVRDMLDAVADAVRFSAADRLALGTIAPPPATDEVPTRAGNESGSGAAAARARTEGYSSRDEAMADLLRIAAFFRQHEPHSPMSYTLEEAVRRGRLSLPELLADLLSDEAARRMFLTSAGIKPAEDAH